MEQIVFDIVREMEIVRIIGNIIFHIWSLTLKFLAVIMSSCRFLSGYFQFLCHYYSSIAPYQCCY